MKNKVTKVEFTLSDGSTKSVSLKSGYDGFMELLDNGIMPLAELTQLYERDELLEAFDPDFSFWASEAL